MALADRLSTLDSASLVNLRDNAARLLAGPQDARHGEAAALLPLIEAEMASRVVVKPKAPPRTKAKVLQTGVSQKGVLKPIPVA